MARSTDGAALRQALLQLLEADPPQEERLLADLERRQEEGQPLYSAALYLLTHLQFPEAEARRHWRRILAHRDLLRMTLGRDVGLRVALLDYFVNVSKELRNPKVIEISIYERTARSAVTDGLTGLFNHAYFVQALRREVQRSRRHGLTVSLALFDIDDFKKVNDTLGHLEGDKVLMKAASLIHDSLREIDVAARYGGEEFAVILPETGREGAFVVADRIRARIGEHFRRRKDGPRVTVSGGVAAFPGDAGGVEDLIRRSDEGLYRSKADGKNQVTLVDGERRRNPRVPASHHVLLRGRTVRQAAARTKNVSEGGLLLNLKQSVPVGSPVSLVIRPRGGGAPLGLKGEVVRVAPAGEGAGYDLGIRLAADPNQAAVVFRRLTGAGA
ncbi:MAG: diguanylate cyclase [Acidobacteria bacterium]|nr:diguanylate cyclase [Acidobacteriota bacterium]